jgi:hypothetical protein
VVSTAIQLLAVFVTMLSADVCTAAPPVVSNVRASQLVGTKLVDLFFDLSDSDTAKVRISVQISNNGVTLPALSLSGTGYGENVIPRRGLWIRWNAGLDWGGNISKSVKFRVIADDAPLFFSINNQTQAVTVNKGALLTLRWSATDAVTRCDSIQGWIQPDIGSSGTHTLIANAGGIYTITATTAFGISSKSVQVFLNPGGGEF